MHDCTFQTKLELRPVLVAQHEDPRVLSGDNMETKLNIYVFIGEDLNVEFFYMLNKEHITVYKVLE
jgi:hypothetical protein